jgi:hypothetical protein
MTAAGRIDLLRRSAARTDPSTLGRGTAGSGGAADGPSVSGGRTRIALVAAALLALGGGGTSRASWGERQDLLVRAVGGDYPELDVTLDVASDDGPPGRIVIYVPARFQLYPDRPPGSAVGTVSIEAEDSSFGTPTDSSLAGDIVAQQLDAAAEEAAQACSPGKHVALWNLQLSLLGQPLDVPLYLARTGAGDPPGPRLKLVLCAPTLPAQDPASARALPISFVSLSLTDVAAPRALGSYLWRAVVTPLAPDRRTLRQGRAYEVRALVPVPNRLTLGGRYSAGQAILTGRLTAGGRPRARVQVRIVKLARVITPSGVVFRDAIAGFVRTDRTGRFTFRAKLPKTAGFVAFVDEGSTRCSGRSIAPGGCKGTSIAGTGSEALTVSVP